MEEEFDIWRQEPCYDSNDFTQHAIKFYYGALVDIRCNIHCFYSRRYYQGLREQIFK